MSGVRAAVMTGPGRIAIEEFPRPSVEPGAVLMQVVYSGICGTDKHTFRGENKQYAGTPHERALEYPLICGHEKTGGEVRDSGFSCDCCGTRPDARLVEQIKVVAGAGFEPATFRL